MSRPQTPAIFPYRNLDSGDWFTKVVTRPLFDWILKSGSVAFGADDLPQRLTTLLFSTLLIPASFWGGRFVGGELLGLLIAAVLAFSREVAVASVQASPDVAGGMALLLFLIAFFTDWPPSETKIGRPGGRFRRPRQAAFLAVMTVVLCLANPFGALLAVPLASIRFFQQEFSPAASLRRLAMLAVVVGLIAHTGRAGVGGVSARAPRESAQDEITIHESRLEPVRRELPGVRVIGYLTDAESLREQVSGWYSTQYVLAPILVERGAAADFVVANFKNRATLAESLTKFNLVVVQELNGDWMLLGRNAW